jgi:hypothetical protein
MGHRAQIRKKKKSSGSDPDEDTTVRYKAIEEEQESHQPASTSAHDHVWRSSEHLASVEQTE